MKALKQLKLEYDGVFGTINEYTDDSNIINYLLKLKEGINDLDYDVVIYSLERIINWYDDNMCEISTNSYVFNLDSHKKTHELLKNLRENLQPEEFVSNSSNSAADSSEKPIIFLSHRSADKKYGHALRNFLVGLGIKNDQLIYTSHPMHKIPMDANIYDYLRGNINSNIFMIILWSDKYLETLCPLLLSGAWTIILSTSSLRNHLILYSIAAVMG